MICLIFVAFIFCNPNSGYSQIPAGGTEIIKEPLANAFRVGGTDKITMTKVPVSDQPFTQAFKIVTSATVSNSWDVQIAFPPAIGIATEDIILVSFYARTTASLDETGLGALVVCLENKTSYDKVVYQNVGIGTEWKQYFVSLKSAVSLPVTNLNCAFHIGFPSQTVEIADIHFYNYFKTITLADLPISIITYIGQDPDAAWRAEAEERINLIRKGNIQVSIIDSTGAPVKDAELSIQMTRHNFGFGSAVVASDYLTNPVYKEKILELFNEVVFENDLKWSTFYYKTAAQKNDLIKVLDDLKSHQIDMRGHNVLWPTYKYNPTYLANYKTQPEKLRLEIDKRIDDVCKFTKGRVIDWDVINEPYTEHEWMDLLGNEAMADWFKRVRNNDPNVKLYLNDFNILSGNGTNVPKQDAYMETVRYIDGLGGNVQGIGFQGHFGSDLTPITRLKSILDKFSVLKKDIKITEFDIDVNQDSVKADYTRDFMTMMFSHPSVKGFLMWGFWENRHWKPTAAMYKADWSIRPNGEAYKELVLNKWWTGDTTQITDSTGILNFNGFLGTYSYTLKYDTIIKTGSFKVLRSVSDGISNEITLSTHLDVPDQIEISLIGESSICEGNSSTLSISQPKDFTLEWYNGETLLPDTDTSITVSETGTYKAVASGKGIILNSEPVTITVNSYPEAKIDSSGTLSFCSGGSVILSTASATPNTYKWYKNGVFYQGSTLSLTTSESGKYKVEVNSNGCKTTSTELTVTKLSTLNPLCSTGIEKYSTDLYAAPNPFEKVFYINGSMLDSYPAEIELIDSYGKLVYKTTLENSDNAEIIPDVCSGLYILNIETKTGSKRQKLVCQ